MFLTFSPLFYYSRDLIISATLGANLSSAPGKSNLEPLRPSTFSSPSASEPGNSIFSPVFPGVNSALGSSDTTVLEYLLVHQLFLVLLHL